MTTCLKQHVLHSSITFYSFYIYISSKNSCVYKILSFILFLLVLTFMARFVKVRPVGQWQEQVGGTIITNLSKSLEVLDFLY